MSHMIESIRQTLSGINSHASTPLEAGLIALVNRRPSTYDLPNHASPMSRLPVELLLQIAEHLNQIDRICLALTSKGAYALMKGKKLVQPIRFYNLLDATSSYCHVCSSLRYHEFNVIQRLSNSRWKACPRCVKLHPFSKVTDSIHPFLAPIRYLKDVVGTTCYLSQGKQGRVFLCQCIAINYHQKVEMINQLRERIQQSNSEAVISRCTSSYTRPWHTSSNSRPWHTCTIRVGKMSKMIIEHFPYLLHYHDNGKCHEGLVIYTKYQWVPCAWNRDGSWEDDIYYGLNILACPHRNVLTHWQDWMMSDSGIHRWASDRMPDFNNLGLLLCAFCNTNYTRIEEKCACNVGGNRIHYCKQKGSLRVLHLLGPDHVPQPGTVDGWSRRAQGKVLTRPFEDSEVIHDEDCPRRGDVNCSCTTPWMPCYRWNR
jgi:hypothetical protein